MSFFISVYSNFHFLSYAICFAFASKKLLSHSETQQTPEEGKCVHNRNVVKKKKKRQLSLN